MFNPRGLFLVRIAALAGLLFSFGVGQAVAGTLTCTVATTCDGGVVVFRMSDTSNAHAELAGQSNYTQLVCCSGVASLGTSCSGTFATVATLSGTTNAHVEQNSEANYANDVCLSVPDGGSVSVGYQSSNCSGFDTTVASMSATTNAHVGNASAYTTKICATASDGASQSLSFSISDSTIGFGALSASAARYATGDTTGSSTDSANAHTLTASTNATSGYAISVNGTTLTCADCSGATITAVGGSAAASSPGSEQFGIRLTATGNGTATSPYASADWAFDTGSFPDQVASGAGDGTSTTFGVRYIANISSVTDPGSYSAVLTYTITAVY